jgi:hypothetical protein
MDMNKKYQITVFGKTGCDKSKVLRQRVEKLAANQTTALVDHAYFDVETIDGIVCLAEAECIDPRRIPAMLVSEWDDEAGEYLPVPAKEPGAPDPVCKGARLFQHVGLQTDYSESGKGLLTPEMIETVLAEATN